jgi:dipeptidyl aminopeptidase/acylaminoacyl peptidase
MRIALLLLLSLAPAAAAQEATYVVRRGADTVAVETVRRSAGRLEATLLDPGQRIRWRYAATLGPGETVARFENAFSLASDTVGAEPRQRAEFAFEGDSVIAIINPGPEARVQRLGSRAGALPFINPSFALVEQAIRRARVLGGDSVVVPLFAVSGGQTFEALVLRARTDSAEVRIGAAVAQFRMDGAGMLASGTVPAQGLVLERVGAAAAGPMVLAERDYGPPPGAPYTALEARIPSAEGVVLAGTLTIPAGASAGRRVPAVVTISGSGPQDRDEAIPMVKGYAPFREIADTLARRGIAVLRYDDRGFGRSTGHYAAATPLDFAADVRAVLAWLRQRPEVDPARIALLGHSEGGLVAPIVAADDSLLAGVVLMAGPSRTGRRILAYQNRMAIEQDTAIAPGARDSALAAAMMKLDSLARVGGWMGFFLDHDPLPTARRLRLPVLILHGATDRQVTADQADELAEAIRSAGNRNVVKHTFAETNHLFLADREGYPSGYVRLRDTQVRRNVLGLLTDWLVATLR